MSKTALLSLLAALTIGRAASATSYTIAFTPGYSLNDPSFAASGSFLYDAATGFSNFVVIWDGTSFDLTASANSANSVGLLDACSTGATGAAATFQMLTSCNTVPFTGAYNNPDIGFLFDNNPNYASWVSFGGPSHGASVGFLTAVSALDKPISASYSYDDGSFTVSAVPSVPEPSTVSLLGTGMFALGACWRRFRARR